MAEQTDCEHYIPLRKSDLIDLLCSERDLDDENSCHFKQFCKLVAAIFHFEYNQKLEELKTAYAPFDPDADTRSLVQLSADAKQQKLNELYRDFAWLLDKANFKHLSRESLEPGLDTASAWGIRMQVDFGAFEHLAIFARGDTLQERQRRRLKSLYRTESTKVPVYQRLVLILKLKPDQKLSKQVDTQCVYLKIFKDIPKIDVKMLLPTARVRMTMFDRGKIGFPLISGLGMAIYNIADDVIAAIFRSGASPSFLLWGLATGAVGYGYRSYFGYQQTKQRYHLTLTQSLYYQNLDSNSGVLFRLLDEAEEQECREAFLAYFMLWRFAPCEGWSAKQLDLQVEQYLEQNAKVKVDFEITDALDKLERMRTVEKRGELYCALPILKAMERLDEEWDHYFAYSNAEVGERRT